MICHPKMQRRKESDFIADNDLTSRKFFFKLGAGLEGLIQLEK